MQTEKQQYVITQDTVGLFRPIRPEYDLNSNETFQQASQQYFEGISQTLQTALPQTELCAFQEDVINEELRLRATEFLSQNPNGLCICLDRFMLQEMEEDPATQDRLVRIGVCRNTKSEKVARQGYPSLEDQITELVSRVNAADPVNAIIIDDGLFTGGTVQEVIRLIQESGSAIQIERIIGYIGNGQSSASIEGVDAEIVEKISKMYDWVDTRDFGPFGGKKKDAGSKNKATSAVPYIYPWSMGEGASLNMSPALFQLSREMIGSFQNLVEVYEEQTGGVPLTFLELVKSGFPLPTNMDKTVPISLFDRVNDYLDRCKSMIEREENRRVIVLDMDGTLYDLGDAGFGGSALNAAVNENGISFVMREESCDRSEATLLWQEALQDPIGASRFLAGRYGIDRKQFFDQVWDIDPNLILQNYEEAVGTLRKFTDTVNTGADAIKMILLTSAPSVWAKRVLEFLKLDDVFESVYTGEMYGNKEEVFDILAARYNAEQIVSIGDQEQTDIRPAQDRNMTGILITKPADIASISLFNTI